MTSHCHLSAKHERYVSQGSVETLFRRGGKRLHHIMANITRKVCTKLYRNRSYFVKDTTERF